jgi:hypothetical protein
VLCLIAVTVGAVSVINIVSAKDEAETARLRALVCWHEFASGRRPTTADCPEL